MAARSASICRTPLLTVDGACPSGNSAVLALGLVLYVSMPTGYAPAMTAILKAAEVAIVGGIAGGAMAIGRLARDPDGWAQIGLAVIVFAIAGAVISLIVQAAQAWRRALRPGRWSP